MSPSARAFPALALASALTLAGCAGGSAPDPLACAERAQCPADAFCRAGACVQSSPPVARIVSLASEAPRANRVVAFDASASADPDAEDRVATYAWRAARVSAGCEPAVVETQAASYRVLFPCAGEFQVELVVTDTTGVASPPTTLGLSVAADEVAAPSLRTGAALALDHRCEGDPLACTPVTGEGATSFALSATAAGGRGPLALRWTASPPEGLATPHAIAFSDATAAAPTVALRTTGRISGTWTFTVVATDADGRAAVAEQRVAIGNRPPALGEPLAPVAVHHRYEPLEAAYHAGGRVAPPRFVDPDGDPVVVTYAALASGDGGHGFAVGADGAFAIRIPGAEPQHLIGAAVERSVTVEADDGNGGRVAGAVPLTVLNRPPRIALARSGATVPHRFDAARGVYTASAILSEYVDDDGDPLAPGSSFEQVPAGCSTLALAGATLSLTCEVPFSTVAALAHLARAHLLDVTVRDPWVHSGRAAARVEVTNQPPRVTGSYVQIPTTRSVGSLCCWYDDYEDACGATPNRYEAGEAAFSAVEDPDGDPLDVTYEATSAALVLSRASASACAGAGCAVGLQLAAAGSVTQCLEVPEPGLLRVRVSDGAAAVQRDVGVIRLER